MVTNMDKYEYQLKTEHIRQVAARKEYGEAAKLCDTIDWTKVRDVKMLTLVADVYTAGGEYEKAIDICSRHISIRRWDAVLSIV